jgi:hypothetical protein
MGLSVLPSYPTLRVLSLRVRSSLVLLSVFLCVLVLRHIMLLQLHFAAVLAKSSIIIITITITMIIITIIIIPTTIIIIITLAISLDFRLHASSSCQPLR